MPCTAVYAEWDPEAGTINLERAKELINIRRDADQLKNPPNYG